MKSTQKWVGHKDVETTLKYYAKVKIKEAKVEVSSDMNGLVSIKFYSRNENENN